MKRLLIGLLGVAFVLSACAGDTPPTTATDGGWNAVGGIWMAIEPTQCLTNPWERDWLEQHNGDYDGYPGSPAPELTPEEVDILTDFYARQGVVVLDTATAAKYDMVCLACSCPEGHTMFLRVRPQDVATLEKSGYRREAPPA